MELDIRALGLHPTPAFRQYFERRLRHALRSYDIDRVTARLVRHHGRGRGTAHGCEVAVASHGLETLRVGETHRSMQVACVRAADKARRALARRLLRSRRLSRVEGHTTSLA